MILQRLMFQLWIKNRGLLVSLLDNRLLRTRRTLLRFVSLPRGQKAP